MEQQLKRFIIITPKSMSKSARALKEELKTYIKVPIFLVSPHSKTYQCRWTDYVLNWGYGKETEYLHFVPHMPIADAVDKHTAFKILTYSDIPTVEWTTEQGIAKEWRDSGKTVIGRTTLKGHSGDGIIILDDTEEWHPDCKLYTLYKKKKNEYRVHVIKDEVVDITQKKKKVGAPNLDTKIRNYHNGWVYCRSDIHIPDDLTELALRAVRAFGLFIGAVDIIWNEKENKCYVLEVNTAPGLTGTTLTKYAQALAKDFES